MRGTNNLRWVASAAIVALVAVACGSSSSKAKPSDVEAAQRRVTSKQEAVAEAQKAYDSAAAKFCGNTKSYITALDSYGKLFDDSAATVGDVKKAGTDLAAPRADVATSAQDVQQKQADLASANGELVAAQDALAAAQAAASGASTTSTPPPTSTSTTTIVPQATIDRVKKAESDFESATKGITDATPLVRATVEVNSAAFALEVAWLRVFYDARCFTADQQQKAVKALIDYTTALQTALQGVGYYTGEIDGVYGPATVDAVKKLQTASLLPVTGYVDRATQAALNRATVSKGGAAAAASSAQVTAVQTTLKLAGYWTGPIDGRWTPELTDALKKFQTSLGVPATGAVDTATLAALETTIAEAKTAATSTTTVAATTTAPPTTTAAATTTATS
jgi:peptidoglycan hydrolase-like protein with peptidoglycan-binding domain